MASEQAILRFLKCGRQLAKQGPGPPSALLVTAALMEHFTNAAATAESRTPWGCKANGTALLKTVILCARQALQQLHGGLHQEVDEDLHTAADIIGVNPAGQLPVADVAYLPGSLDLALALQTPVTLAPAHTCP